MSGCERNHGHPGKARGIERSAVSHPPHTTTSSLMKHRIEILYCTQCRWLLRAAWMAQELLSTFDQEIAELTLKPGTGGVFEIRADDVLLWSRKDRGGFPEISELKRLVRDQIAPQRSLGHAEKAPFKEAPS